MELCHGLEFCSKQNKIITSGRNFPFITIDYCDVSVLKTFKTLFLQAGE